MLSKREIRHKQHILRKLQAQRKDLQRQLNHDRKEGTLDPEVEAQRQAEIRKIRHIVDRMRNKLNKEQHNVAG